MVAPSVTRAREALVGVLAFALGCAVLERVGVALATPATDAAPALAANAGAPRGQPAAGADRAPSVTSYRISARLDPTSHRVDGKETIHFVNRSSRALGELYFHLYLNAFKNDASTFLRSPFGEARSTLRASDWGYI